MNDTAERIIDLAETAIAIKGYSAFSFREVATAMGIKSASVHYHFPTKVHLGLAVATRYRARYQAALIEIDRRELNPLGALTALVDIYRQYLLGSEGMSVCMMLAAEIKILPLEVQAEMRAFYHLNLDWLAKQVALQCPLLTAAETQVIASQLFALLQGALMGAKTQAAPDYFERVVLAFSNLLRQ